MFIRTLEFTDLNHIDGEDGLHNDSNDMDFLTSKLNLYSSSL